MSGFPIWPARAGCLCGAARLPVHRLLVIGFAHRRARLLPADPLRRELSARQQRRAQRADQKDLAVGSRLDDRIAADLRPAVDLGRAALPPPLQRRRPTRCRSTSSASNGCGRRSIPAASARSTSCTCRSAATFGWCMASQDVIHSFFVPAFRIKQDVVPGRYETMWFRADTPGRYHLFCAEYCGTDHAHMGGWLMVMKPREFARLAARRRAAQATLAAQGERPVPALWLQRLPRAGRHGPRAAARGRVRKPGAAVGRQRRHRRRALHPRFDPRPEGAGRRRLCAGHADLRRAARARTISPSSSPTSNRSAPAGERGAR